MHESNSSTRREMLTTAGAAGAALLASTAINSASASPAAAETKVRRIGVVSARIKGAPQRLNGHCWQFTYAFHERCNLEVVRRLLDPGRIELFEKLFFNTRVDFGPPLWHDARVTHYYEADPENAALYAEAFPGVQVATSLEEMVKEVDAVWLGDASGFGEDHFDLVAPGLERGLPTFCDKPIGGSVPETRKILEFARAHKAPLMSSSLFRHQWGAEEARRRRDSGEFGPLMYVLASQGGAYSADGWIVYGQHPVWALVSLCGPGVSGVNMIAHEGTCHALLTYPDRMPAQAFCGHRNIAGAYCSTSVYFSKGEYTYTPAIAGNYWLGHAYQIFNMQRAFRDMLTTGVEPVPHEEILAVTGIVHAAAKSLREGSRVVSLEEVAG